jgi:Tfp pilus assembly protein PilV
MNKASNSEKGFSVVEVLLIVVVLVVIGVAGYMVYKNHQSSTVNTISTSSNKQTSKTSSSKSASSTTGSPQSANPYLGWDTFTNQQAGLTFKYPSTWTSQVTPNSALTTDPSMFAGISGTLTSPSGNPLYWIYQVIGGKGDAVCTPAPNDTPFAPGDACASRQIISVEQITSVQKPPNTSFYNLFGDSLYITETKYSPGSSGFFASNPPNAQPPASDAVTYQICLDPFTSGEGSNPPIVGTQMGVEFQCNYWDTGFNVIFPVPNEASFNSTDAKTAILIMKSFNSLQ